MKYDWKWRLKKRVADGPKYFLCGGISCSDCPFLIPDSGCVRREFSSEVEPLLFRHLLSTVKDFDDNDEIRERIAEMLDDPEKFLGKAEPEYGVHTSDGQCLAYRPGLVDGHTPVFRHLIFKGGVSEQIIAALRDRNTAEKVAEFLNA